MVNATDFRQVGTVFESHLFRARYSSVVRAFAHGAMGRRIDPSWGGPIELFLVPASAPRLIVHIKEPLLLIGNSSLCGGSGFPFSLSEWSLTICLMPYNRKQNVFSASLNKTFPFLSFPTCFGIRVLEIDSSLTSTRGDASYIRLVMRNS